MSLFSNDPASCGVNNSLNKFASHANLDHSLNNQFQNNSLQQKQQPGLNNYNTINQIDRNLQNDFQNFSSNITQFQPSLQQETQFSPQLNQQQQNQGWINDFHQMSINERQKLVAAPVMVSSSASMSREWSSEFNSASSQQIPQIRQQEQYNVKHATLSLQNRGILNTASSVSNTSQFSQSYNTEQATSQLQELQKSTDFDQAFNDIESELLSKQSPPTKLEDEEMEVDQPPQQPDVSDKLDFARIAQQVFNTMTNTPTSVSTTTSTKFKNSNFLKLMDRISKREVEINDDKTKFIDSNGNDVRDMLADPLKDIKDGEFNDVGSFDAGKIVHERLGNGDLKRSDWEEVL